MIKIITDSTCDLSAELAKQLDIEVIPLTVFFGEEAYRDGVDITRSEFMERLKASEELPTTSQLNPDLIHRVFEKYISQGYDVFSIFVSSALSGTCQSAQIAAGMLSEGQIYVCDSESATLGLALLLLQAAALRDSGCTLKQLSEQMETYKKKVRLYAMLDTLKFLQKGGRISAATAAVGGLLGIKPIVSIVDGRVEAIGKARGKEAAFSQIKSKLLESPPLKNTPVVTAHAASPSLLSAFGKMLEDSADLRGAVTIEIGSVVGTYTGPGAVGIAYFAE